MSNYKIIMTGGGTAGHVTPNLALVPKLKEKGFDIKYIGSYKGNNSRCRNTILCNFIRKIKKIL